MAQFRVVRSSRIEHVSGYVASEADRVHYQQLQAKAHNGSLEWVTIDEEVIPPSVLIDLGCFGATEWKSKFNDLNKIGTIEWARP